MGAKIERSQSTDLNYYKNEIAKQLQNQKKNSFQLGGILQKLKLSESFKSEINTKTNKNYKNVFEYVKVNFNLASTSCKNYIGVSVKFCDENFNPKSGYENYSFSQLVEMLPLSDEQIKLVNAEMSCVEIRLLRSVKNSQSTDQKQVREKTLKPDCEPYRVNFKRNIFNKILSYLKEENKEKKNDDERISIDDFINKVCGWYLKEN